MKIGNPVLAMAAHSIPARVDPPVQFSIPNSQFAMVHSQRRRAGSNPTKSNQIRLNPTKLLAPSRQIREKVVIPSPRKSSDEQQSEEPEWILSDPLLSGLTPVHTLATRCSDPPCS